uniref:sensor histidine kinase n=1 Tax=Kingella denitrificans TaxID=502 RepID=UPI0011D13890
DFTELVRNVLDQYQADALGKGCTFSLRAPGPVYGMWDAARLEQVVVNLVSNALKYGRGAPIELTIEQAPEQVHFSIQD